MTRFAPDDDIDRFELALLAESGRRRRARREPCWCRICGERLADGPVGEPDVCDHHATEPGGSPP